MAYPEDSIVGDNYIDEPLEPATEAEIPMPLTYTHPTTSARVELTCSPNFNIARHTPYGILDPSDSSENNNHALAWQWAIDNMDEPDPLARLSPEQAVGSQTVLGGGPPGCFWPELPCAGTASSDYWKPHNTIFYPPGKGRGSRGFKNNAPGANTNNAASTRVNWGYMSDRTKPGIIVQSESVEISGMDLAGYSSNETWRGRLPCVLAYADVDSTSNDFYYTARNNLQGAGTLPRDFIVTDCNFSGADYGIMVGSLDNGSSSSDSGCDYLRATGCRFGQVGTGIYFRSLFSGQAVVLDNCRASSYDNYVFYFYYPMNAVIRNLNPGFNSGTTDSNTAFIGMRETSMHNGNIRFENTKIDNNFEDGVLLDAQCSNLNIVFNGGVDSPLQNNGFGFVADRIKLGGNNSLTIRDWGGVQGITTLGAGSIVNIENGCFIGSTYRDDPRSVVDETAGALNRFNATGYGKEGLTVDDVPTGNGDTYVSNNSFYIDSSEYDPTSGGSSGDIIWN